MSAKFLFAVIYLWLLLVSFLTGTSAYGSTEIQGWSDPAWLAIYQYHNSKSDINSQNFFFSDKGADSPEEEYLAAIQAFSNPQNKYGVQLQAAACVFPARKIVLEKLSGKKFPNPKCSDLTNWLEQLNPKAVSLVFAGAYSGNPASILGHTFLRIDSAKKAAQSLELLSYSVGFLAVPDPSDGRLFYIFRGLTGQYPGYYDIEPHYMKVGLYNNSESRDLWSWPLNLNDQEVIFLTKHLWELTFNARTPYYFIRRNCSYRIFALLQSVRPWVNFTDNASYVVEPSESIVFAIKNGFIDDSPQFRSSIKRKIQYQLHSLKKSQLKEFQKSKTNLDEVSKLDDIAVLDTLIDHWTYQSYKNRMKLSKNNHQLMEASFLKRSNIDVTTSPIEDGAIIKHFNLSDPMTGHPARMLRTSFTKPDSSQDRDGYVGISFRTGFQPVWADHRGFEDIAELEYLGFDWNSRAEKSFDVTFLNIANLNPIGLGEIPPSWSFELKFGPDKLLSPRAGLGLTAKIFQAKAFALAEISGQTYGGRLGMMFQLNDYSFFAARRYELTYRDQRNSFEDQVDVSYFINRYWTLLIERSKSTSQLSLARFF